MKKLFLILAVTAFFAAGCDNNRRNDGNNDSVDAQYDANNSDNRTENYSEDMSTVPGDTLMDTGRDTSNYMEDDRGTNLNNQIPRNNTTTGQDTTR